MTAEEKSRWWSQQMVLWLIAATLGLILGGFLGYVIALACAPMVFLSGLLTIGFARDEKREQDGGS